MSRIELDTMYQDLPEILDGNKEKLVQRADEIGNYLGRQLSTSQIRNVFYEVKSMSSSDVEQLHLLRPKLAYLAGRHGHRRGNKLTGGIVTLQQIMDEAVKIVLQENTAERFKNFQSFFEAILAYHKYYGGKD